jgi:anti-anti-sigma factor
MMNGIKLNKEIIDKVLVINLPRILGHVNSIDIGQEIILNIRKEPSELIILLNCKDLIQINNSGLRVFVITLQKLKQSDRKLNLCEVSEPVYRFFEEAGVANEFQIFNTLEAALDALKSKK